VMHDQYSQDRNKEEMNITAKECEHGSNLCRENALQWIEDAHLLMQNKSYGHALSTVFFALEEYAKRLMLYQCYKNPKIENRSNILKKAFCDHKFKYAVVIKFLIHGNRSFGGVGYDNLPSLKYELERLFEYAEGFRDHRVNSIYINITKRECLHAINRFQKVFVAIEGIINEDLKPSI